MTTQADPSADKPATASLRRTPDGAAVGSYLQQCPVCQHEFAARRELVGKRVLCPHCRKALTIQPTRPQQDPNIGRPFADFVLQERLGAGSYGYVYRARAADGRDVAVKLISEQAAARSTVLARFRREAELGAVIQHPHVVGVLGFGRQQGAWFMVMDYVDGPTLNLVVQEQGPRPWREALALARQTAEAVAALHGRGIIHRDIKPANLLLGSDGRARLADLGLAKQLTPGEGDEEQGGLTMAGTALGSPAFMAPEQAGNAHEAGTACDLYALGATLFFLLAGRPPYEGASPGAIFTQLQDVPPADLAALVPGLPDDVVLLVRRLMARAPAERPDIATALGWLDAIAAGQAVPDIRPATPTFWRRLWRRFLGRR